MGQLPVDGKLLPLMHALPAVAVAGIARLRLCPAARPRRPPELGKAREVRRRAQGDALAQCRAEREPCQRQNMDTTLTQRMLGTPRVADLGALMSICITAALVMIVYGVRRARCTRRGLTVSIELDLS